MNNHFLVKLEEWRKKHKQSLRREKEQMKSQQQVQEKGRTMCKLWHYRADSPFVRTKVVKYVQCKSIVVYIPTLHLQSDYLNWIFWSDPNIWVVSGSCF